MKNIFDWTKEIMATKRPWSSFSDGDKKLFDGFMCNKILSMNPDYIQIVNYVQKIAPTEKEKLYTIYCEFIPKGYKFSKFIKANKKSMNKDLLEKISQFYECSIKEAEQYLEFMDDKIITDILQKLGCDDKEIKKLLK